MKKNTEKKILLEPAEQAKLHQQTRLDHETEIAEDYVEVIDDLINLNGEARAVDIAKRLGVTHVTVNKTIARLQKEGLVTSEPYRSIFLTAKGKKLAEESRERHEIVLNFLRSLGISERMALQDSEGIEHHVSKETLQAFKKFTKN